MPSLTVQELNDLMQEAADYVGPETEETVEVESRRGLDAEECHDIHRWLMALPNIVWSKEDGEWVLEHLLESRNAVLTIPKHMTGAAIYFKVKWG